VVVAPPLKKTNFYLASAHVTLLKGLALGLEKPADTLKSSHFVSESALDVVGQAMAESIEAAVEGVAEHERGDHAWI
jgi:hypothetical protein